MEVLSTTQLASALAEKWQLSLLIGLIAIAIYTAVQVMSRPTIPANAPRILKGLPILGSVNFFRARADFLRAGKAWAPKGLFSFYYGPHRVVAVSRDTDKKIFFSHRALDFAAGYAALFAGAPDVRHMGDEDETKQTTERFSILFKRFLAKPRLHACLENLVSDTIATFDAFDTSKPMDPFDTMYKLIFQLTHRTVGCNDIAADPKLLKKSLAMFTDLDATGAIEVMFPWLPTPVKLRKLWGGARMHWMFQRIIKKRREQDQPGNDAMQLMMDAGDTDLQISVFIIGALFAGVVNSGINAAWIPIYLAQNEKWRQLVQAEVDASLDKYRHEPGDTPADIIPRLTAHDWDNDFPTVDLVLRESIRLNICGSMIRKNVSGKDIDITGSGYVIPSNTFAVYLIDYTHMNPEIYTDPTEFDPGRYLPGREEDKKVDNAYLGWGAGLHPCLGMRFAKLEMAMLIVTLMAYFDFDLCDKQGNPRTTPIPRTDRNWPSVRPIEFDLLEVK
ncbi:Cytochrome P450 [Akanthomyces lecanii RCEF 1005]|uniref:Cytochrome P450 n=1 Tax=Akanthomyces lecanii RCEF 1005 TaxID=1081108 RepID=A0A168GYS3_CORDF|nr:Cytochrome P450 [Akanthomyces lecanii RCEF 1005]